MCLHYIKVNTIQGHTIQGLLYSGLHLKSTKPYSCSADTAKPSWIIFTISESFLMRYYKILYLKGYQKYNRSKLIFDKSWTFSFDLFHFWYPLNCKVIQYLIGKLSVKGESRGLSCGSTFSICQRILKNDTLLHKQGFVDS